MPFSGKPKSGGPFQSVRRILAVILTIGFLPFTSAMLPAYNKLLALQRPNPRRDANASEEASKEIAALLENWSKMNLVRSVFPLLGTGVAWSTTLL